jgi:hypothetical protein
MPEAIRAKGDEILSAQTGYTREQRACWDDFASPFERWDGPRSYY